MRRLFIFLLVVTAAVAGAWKYGYVPQPALVGAGGLTAFVGVLAATSYLPRGGRRAMGLLYVFLMFAGLIGGLYYFQFIFKPQMIKGFIAAAPQPVQTVAVGEAKTESWAPSITAIGTLRAVAGADIAPQVGGVIVELDFDRGQDVKKGDTLARLDDSVEQADLRSNQATLKNADITLDRQKGLIVGGNTARSTLDQAQAARDTAAAAVEKSKALIAQKTIAAPFAGRIGLRKVDLGQFVGAGASIANIQQLDPIYVDFPVPEQDLSDMKIGAEISFAVDAYPGKTFKGAIKSIDSRVDAATRTVQVRGEAPNPDKTLLPGMFANITVSAGSPRSLVTVSRTAVTYSLYGDTIFVVTPLPPPADAGAQAAPANQGDLRLLERRNVKVGDTREDRIAINDGVKAGDVVVIEGQIKLQPGMKVRVDNASALPPPLTPRPKE